MKEDLLVVVTLDNGDVALFVNGDAVLTLDAGDAGMDPGTVGESLAKALGVELRSAELDVPDDDEWSWNDVYDALPEAVKRPVARKPEAVMAALRDAGMDFGVCTQAFAEPEDDPYVLAAKERVEEGRLEVDDLAVVTRGDDAGAYVMAWLWVDHEAAGISD